MSDGGEGGATDVIINLEINLTALQKKVSLNPICGRRGVRGSARFLAQPFREASLTHNS